jgi:hypothetical protein
VQAVYFEPSAVLDLANPRVGLKHLTARPDRSQAYEVQRCFLSRRLCFLMSTGVLSSLPMLYVWVQHPLPIHVPSLLPLTQVCITTAQLASAGLSFETHAVLAVRGSNAAAPQLLHLLAWVPGSFLRGSTHRLQLRGRGEDGRPAYRGVCLCT